ncbi:zinc finger CCCH domain-containing protein 7 [Aristolochia californica]|uniref:zinc finger CCCH domain-containing protein 7 n=1 Tax=Aristolochia californica TaxID=171875 RepID=UPI0035DB2F53
MLGHYQLRDSLGLRPRLKSTTVCTLLHILSHCADDAPKPDSVSKPLPVSSVPSENSRLCNNLLSEMPVNSCPNNPITIPNSETSGAKNEIFPEGSSFVGTVGQAIHGEVDHGLVDYANFQVDGFSTDFEPLVDEMTEAASPPNEILCGRGVVFGKEGLDTTDFEKLLADRETLNDEGSLGHNLHVMLGEGTSGICSSIMEVDTTLAANEQMTNGNTLAVDCGFETLCGGTSPAGKTRNFVCKEAQYTGKYDNENSEISNLTMVKDSTAGENSELDESQNCIGEGKTLESMVTSDAITNSSSTKVEVCTSTKHDFVNLTGDKEIEDGEISDDSGISIPLLDSLLEVASASEERVESKGTSYLYRKGGFPLGHELQTETDNPDSSFSRDEGIGGQSETGLLSRTSMIGGVMVESSSFNVEEENVCCNGNKAKMHERVSGHDTEELHGAISKGGLTLNQGEQSEKKDVKIHEKKKRTLTEERKSKKKIAKKRKRAEMNRKLGVKRLKLEPISKPKVVNHCKYYLKGRCQQGDKCNFSHDTVPLTKSQPCKYFALKSCLRGDDCPYDHELSKYPCHNYTSKGTCIRGDSCFFSHKVPVSQDSSKESNDRANLQKQLNNNSNSDMATNNLFKRTSPSAPSPLGSSLHRQPKEQLTNIRPRPTLGAPPEGRTFLSFSPNAPSPLGSSLDRQPKERLTEKRSRPTLGAPPEGITFLSFGKPPGNTSETDRQKESSPSSTNMSMPLRSLGSQHPSHLSTNTSASGLNSVISSTRLHYPPHPRAKLKPEDVKNQSNSSPVEPQSTNSKGSLLATSTSTRRLENGATDASSILEEFLFGALE